MNSVMHWLTQMKTAQEISTDLGAFYNRCHSRPFRYSHRPLLRIQKERAHRDERYVIPFLRQLPIGSGAFFYSAHLLH